MDYGMIPRFHVDHPMKGENDNMKKKTIAIVITVLCLFSMFPTAAFAQNVGQVQIYDTGREGLALKASPDVDAARYLYIPENTSISIDQISNGWGHTSYYGKTGWVALQYTKIQGSYATPQPSWGIITPASYMVYATDGEGLGLRVDPTIDRKSVVPIPEGTTVLVTAIQDDWAFTSYNGYYGWANLHHLRQWITPQSPTQTCYYVSVYDTGREGLALKAAADIQAGRYCFIPENVILTIDYVTDDGWGHTAYNGYAGWVALRYTRIYGTYPTAAPLWGRITPAVYTVRGTDGEGLELRVKPSVEASTFGPIPEGTRLVVEAINNDWAYIQYNGNAGWCNLAHLR